MSKKILLVIAGPTAVGKTSVSIKLGLDLHTEIVSADSRQVYQELTIGTAKPTPSEQSQVTHHFIDFLPLQQDYNAYEFEKEALDFLAKAFRKYPLMILTGGSGMYVDALINGIDLMPDIPVETRQYWKRKWEESGIEYLQKVLAEVDPIYFTQVDKNNPKRLLRALETYTVSGRPFSDFRQGKKNSRYFEVIKIGLERPREELYRRINLRVDQMIADGLFEEAKQFLPYKNYNSLNTVGYKEIFDFYAGSYDQDEAIRLLKRNSRRYAKRQLTWFKKDPQYTWYHPEDYNHLLEFIKARISQINNLS
ncbi:MAG: tRNA (adenosine(37)-N6)-dimethylallyltransferase MiaA [Candidatus Cyclobacteriaceae bacterium M3_2C_046]